MVNQLAVGGRRRGRGQVFLVFERRGNTAATLGATRLCLMARSVPAVVRMLPARGCAVVELNLSRSVMHMLGSLLIRLMRCRVRPSNRAGAGEIREQQGCCREQTHALCQFHHVGNVIPIEGLGQRPPIQPGERDSMNFLQKTGRTEQVETFDVVIVGGGLSGIGTGCHLRRKCPNKSFVILEGRPSLGGTWDLFRYPGVRSDSDMHTLGYNFKPWKEAKSIADGTAILKYIHETAEDFDLGPHIRFGQRVTGAEWDTESASWIVEATRTDTGEKLRFRGNFLAMCSGYFNYESWHKPAFKDIERYQGELLHPQAWPEEVDYAGKQVVVIGSGATAMTLVPAMADEGAHVTMVQRSPTYVVSRPDKDAIANTLRKFLPERVAYAITRWKNITLQNHFYRNCLVKPGKVKNTLLGWVRDHLGPDYDVETHFTPSYNPWEQRLCLIPNADLFRTIKSGAVEVVTGTIESFTETGLKMSSGRDLQADMVVTATGLELLVLGGIKFSVDGKPVKMPECFSYKGMMYSDVPNLVQTFGYINASWTLRSDLTAEYLCRLLNRMDELGMRQCTPRLREEDQGMPERPWIENFSSGYMQRSMHLFPKQSDRAPWHNPQRYTLDKKMIRSAELEDGALRFENPWPAYDEETLGVSAVGQ